MARTTAPLLSFSGKGQISKTMVFASWRGIAYARRYVIPENPNTTAQQTTRNTFKTMTAAWKVTGALHRAPWDRYAAGRPFTDRNAYIGQNVEALRGKADMTDYVGSPGASGGLPAESITVSAGAGQLTVDFTTPTPPNGWTLDSAIAVAFPDQDPAALWGGPFTEGEDASSQSQVVLTGLTAGTLYVVTAWLEWTKPDGRKAYGPSINATGTPS